MSDGLTLVPAGAGAGKTWRIENTLADWVEAGKVATGRILAVTFTEAAASELRGRIRAELMQRGRVSDALEIDRAWVGTIHALGQRILTEHTFAAGRSPDSRLVTEAERDLLIRLELTRSASLAPVMRDLARFGYAWNPMTESTAEDSFRSDLLRTIDILRGLGERGQHPGILAPALAKLDAGYGATQAAEPLTQALVQAAKALLEGFPNSLAQTAGNAAARTAFARDHANLRRSAFTDALTRDWKLWQALRKLRQTKPLPPGYDTLSAQVIEAADGLLHHPGPLADARAHLQALVTGAQEILSSYASAKRRAGLVDYADMITEAEALIRLRPEILNAVLGEIDCVVIDEFQDTNPVQFALLWRLAESAGRALIVGDTKQSIMGFQGADVRLSTALQTAHPENVDPLTHNWRSVPEVMALVNALGPVLFPEGYGPLTPKRPSAGTVALEAIALPSSWADKKNHAPDCIADRVANILSGGEMIVDKASETLRPVRASDIAVLCYTAANCNRVGDALRSRAVPVRIQAQGWLTAPATQVARYALAFAADPDDLHAALGWLMLGPAQMPAEDALRNAVEGVLPTHAALAPLTNLAAADCSVAEALVRIIAQTGLRDWALGLAEPEQALADLARLEAEAQTFDSMAAELKAAAGFYGTGVQIFLGWIAAQTDKDWDRHPDPDGWTASGVEVSTWHAAKGREWPITIVAGLDFKFPERPGSLRAEFDSFDDLAHVLDHAGLDWLPNFAAAEKQQIYADQLIAVDEDRAARALYVAFTRARDRLILVLPSEPSKPKDRPTRMVDLLRARSGLILGAGNITICGETLPCRITHEPKDRAFPLPDLPPKQIRHRFGTAQTALTSQRTPWRQTPSSLAPQTLAVLPPLTHIDLGARVGGQPDGFAQATERGSAWHLAFRCLVERPNLAPQLAAATGLNPAMLAQIDAQAKALRGWLATEGYDQLHFELPLQQRCADGSEVNAIIDCLAEGPAGLLILDHKSGPCPDPSLRFAGYLPQLAAYAKLIAQLWPDKPLRGIAINWMNEGRVSLAPAPQMQKV